MEPHASLNYEDSGPITISELQRSVHNSAGKKRTDFKRQKAHRDKAKTITTDHNQQDAKSNSTIEEPILNRLRSRLDPTYNVTPSGAGALSVDSDSPFESSTPAVTPAVDKPRTKKKKRLEKSDSTALQDSNSQPIAADHLTAEAQPADNVIEVARTENDDRLLRTSPLRQLPVEPAELNIGESHQENIGRFQPTRQYSDPEDPHLLVSQEDIVHDNIDEMVTDILPQEPPRVIERPATVFVEQKGKHAFSAFKRDDLVADPSVSQRDSVHPMTIASTSKLCQYIYTVITKMSNISHGLLAGISLWECIVVNLLAKEEPTQILLVQFYSMLSLPSHFIHLLLLTITITSLFDRLDIVKTNRTCLDTFLKSPQHLSVIISLVFVLIGFVMTLSIVAIDEQISLFFDAPNEWLDVLTTLNTSESIPSRTAPYTINNMYIPSGSTSRRLDSWLAINVVRAICYNISWMLSVWMISYNRLEERLQV